MTAVARRIQYNTQVIPYNVNSITPTSIVFEEYTQTYASTNDDVIDSTIKKSYGCNNYLDVTANQVNSNWYGIDKKWNTSYEEWETATKNWEDGGEALTNTGESLSSSSTVVKFAYFKNVGDNPILISNDGGNNYAFIIPTNAALYFHPNNKGGNTFYAKTSTGDSNLEFLLAI
jgi:hypothetical protein